ncbi:hypothetical protein EJ06DRAFT_195429 [Trichodelitschia bisporula]|uniref:R3H domain protein n=1 Tax=Trichodelitschia bisporula TaxID=703511 RepID=A0A6G1I7L8_9PEZI|nr:hypothetical protein EJ06DRAFT_195429 [Trichodelitschia bisporula]
MNSHSDMYYENPSQRSPGSHRHPSQVLHRQPSRQFDTYGGLGSVLYAPDDHASQQSYGPRYPDRVGAATLNSGYSAYDPWNSYGTAHGNSLAGIGATTRVKSLSTRGRAGLPSSWMEANPLSSMGPIPGFGGNSMGHAAMRGDQMGSDGDEELIPTAIVIKNIPFAVKKEQLVQLMTEMGLPLPYAFNYHFDNGIFRGLAFANFTTAEETAVVINALNHYELLGRKLRVEYKKMLPQAERDRIEREKRERRGQLEEQHQPSTQIQKHPSIGQLSNFPPPSPSPLSSRNAKLEVDLNDPQVLMFYNQLLLFKEDAARDTMTLPSTLSPAERRIVHTLAHYMCLAHVSKGTGDQRAVHIFRVHDGPNNMSPPVPQMPTSHPSDTHRRALNRAATTDFSDFRGEGFYGTLGRQPSGLLGFPDSPGGLTSAHNLRAAKSYADLRSYTPSPVPSTASFPATLSTNFARFADYGHGTTGSSNPNLTSTTSSMAGREESLLVNGLGNMSIGGGFGQGGSPRSLRSAWERETPGPIGGHRSFSTATYDEQNRERGQGLPSRQPRGPIPERGTGFTSRARQNGGHSGRGSDEISSQSGVEICVE